MYLSSVVKPDSQADASQRQPAAAAANQRSARTTPVLDAAGPSRKTL
jgi:hypothetical protein